MIVVIDNRLCYTTKQKRGINLDEIVDIHLGKIWLLHFIIIFNAFKRRKKNIRPVHCMYILFSFFTYLIVFTIICFCVKYVATYTYQSEERFSMKTAAQ